MKYLAVVEFSLWCLRALRRMKDENKLSFCDCETDKCGQHKDIYIKTKRWLSTVNQGCARIQSRTWPRSNAHPGMGNSTVLSVSICEARQRQGVKSENRKNEK